MTTVDNQPRPAPITDDVYDPDDVGLQNSPLLKPMNFRLEPSPSPEPAVPLPPDSPESSPEPDDRETSSRPKPKYRSSPGDAVLVSFMAGGKHLDVARVAGDNPLASENEEAEENAKGTVVDVSVVERKEEQEVLAKEVEVSIDKDARKDYRELTAIAAGAVGILRENAQVSYDQAQRVATPKNDTIKVEISAPEDPMEDVKPTMSSIPSLKALFVDASIAQSSLDPSSKHELVASPTEEQLPPILQKSPNSALSNGGNPNSIKLPSISESIGDINNFPEPPSAGESPYAQSPPGRPPPRFSAVPGHAHGSPPKSPIDTFRRELPSPGGRGSFYYNVHRRPSLTDGHQYTSAAEYSSSNTETPSTDQSGSTPATIAIDRMSIDEITNPQIGGFQCTSAGCNAPPFQTQYLLNSHANVHSSVRPHYCSVKGCPRSEGGKGFKRKNEMIRHGLVHDSPGYVCPFCPDREHKYPRPDNLQRHVRVHHVDKDKDDPQLREVLSQRPEGPSRGRRRRGGTS